MLVVAVMTGHVAIGHDTVKCPCHLLLHHLVWLYSQPPSASCMFFGDCSTPNGSRAVPALAARSDLQVLAPTESDLQNLHGTCSLDQWVSDGAERDMQVPCGSFPPSLRQLIGGLRVRTPSLQSALAGSRFALRPASPPSGTLFCPNRPRRPRTVSQPFCDCWTIFPTVF